MRGRHKRAKLKPPWPLPSAPFVRWLAIIFLSLIIFTLIMENSHCDYNREAVSRVIQDPMATTLSVKNATSENKDANDDEIVEQNSEKVIPMPQFAQDQTQDFIVVASSHQEEVYLPCKILDLDEDQTVSFAFWNCDYQDCLLNTSGRR